MWEHYSPRITRVPALKKGQGEHKVRPYGFALSLYALSCNQTQLSHYQNMEHIFCVNVKGASRFFERRGGRRRRAYRFG